MSIPLPGEGEGTIPGLDADRVLALSYVPSRARPAVAALWRLDFALGNALAGAREPMIGRIKLAWWRDALEALDRTRAPAEPVLQDAERHLLPAGISGAELARMEEGWSQLASPQTLLPAELEEYAVKRGGLLFRFSARLLGGRGEVEAAGQAWALVNLARRSADGADAEAALRAARERDKGGRWPAPLRPLGMLAVLARRDADPARPHWEEQGAPPRMLRMLRHRLTGL